MLTGEPRGSLPTKQHQHQTATLYSVAGAPRVVAFVHPVWSLAGIVCDDFLVRFIQATAREELCGVVACLRVSRFPHIQQPRSTGKTCTVGVSQRGIVEGYEAGN